MSGPKVVRIVSREEVLMICRRELARVDAALAEWGPVLSRCGLSMPAEVLRRRQQLNALLAGDRFIEVQKQAPLLTEWLDARLEELVNAQFTPEARAARGRAGLAASAASLVAECQARGVKLSEAARQGLEAGDSQEVSRVLSQLAAAQAESGPAVDAALQDRLRPTEARQFLQDWQETQSRQDPRTAVAEKQLTLLRGLGAQVEAFSHRLDAIHQLEDESRRGLQLDSLCIELAGAVRQERSRAQMRREIAALLDQLEETVAYSDDLEAQRAQLQERYQQLLAARAAASTKEAVLNGLHQLGYEVREGMAAAWESQGRLVLQHPSGDGYGVEIGGRGEKLQVRAVGFGAPTSQAKDTAAEERWCGELSQMSSELGKLGGQLEILRSTPVGAQPVKRVVLAQEEERSEEGFEEMKLRSLGEGR